MNKNKYIEANRDAWDEAAPIHAELRLNVLINGFSRANYNYLEEDEIRHLEELEIKGKNVAQIGCNNGRELISIKRLGADCCVGFDISSEFLKQAEQLNKAARTNCEFVQSNVYEIDESYFGYFDFVYISVGVLHWMPDIDGFFKVVSRLLRPEGLVYINETHPILEMIEPGNEGEAVNWVYSYFDRVPVVENDGLNYYSDQQYDSKNMYSFHHKLSDIFTAAINHDLFIDEFEESPEHITGDWFNVEKQGPEVPMSYVLVLVKEG